MNADIIPAALRDITSETEPTLKHLKRQAWCPPCFANGVPKVVVGGSAIEFYTESAYVSGDLDMCLISPPRLDIRTRQELMGQLGTRGGPRNWQAADQCARKLAAVALAGQAEMDWPEVRRLAERPEYRILPALTKLVSDVAHELGKPSPYDS